MNYNTIEVSFKSGQSTIWKADNGDWDDYDYDGKMFIIKKDGNWVGFYNIDSILSIILK